LVVHVPVVHCPEVRALAATSVAAKRKATTRSRVVEKRTEERETAAGAMVNVAEGPLGVGMAACGEWGLWTSRWGDDARVAATCGSRGLFMPIG